MIPELTKQLRRDEGEVLHMYADSLGFATIGVGRLIDDRKGGGISQDESAFLLKNDIDRVINSLVVRIPWFTLLDDARKGVLCNMAFQMGVDGLMAFKKTLDYVQAGDYDGAAHEMMQSRWAHQTRDRALRLAAQMHDGRWR